MEPDNFDFLYALTTFYLEHQQNAKSLAVCKADG